MPTTVAILLSLLLARLSASHQAAKESHLGLALGGIDALVAVPAGEIQNYLPVGGHSAPLGSLSGRRLKRETTAGMFLAFNKNRKGQTDYALIAPKILNYTIGIYLLLMGILDFSVRHLGNPKIR